MNICFYAAAERSGLENNGRTKTILLSADTLRLLGHRVDIVAEKDDCTWFPHHKPATSVPDDADIIIAVSIVDTLKITRCFPERKLCWWMRGLEVPRMHFNDAYYAEDKYYMRLAKRLPVIASNKELQNYLLLYDIYADMCYAGFDLEQWFHIPVRKDSEKIRIGCLFNNAYPTKGWYIFERLIDTLGFKRYEYVAYGAYPKPAHWLKEYKQNPSIGELRALYSSCHMWLAPSTNEGCCAPAAEANLCGCLILSNDNIFNGMDFATEETAMMYANNKELYQQVQKPDYSRVGVMQENIIENIGNREKNMRAFVTILERLCAKGQ